MAKFYPNHALAKLIGGFQLDWEVGSVKELIDYGVKEHGELFSQWIGKASILVNGRNITYLKGKSTPLSENDEVWFVVMHPTNLAGGKAAPEEEPAKEEEIQEEEIQEEG